jgi:hypothetical protein
MARTRWPPICEIPASCPGQADQAGTASGCRNLGPGRQVVIKTARTASADSEVRPGPRPLTLRPHQAKTPQARPEAEKQDQKHYPHPPCRLFAYSSTCPLAGPAAQNSQL